MNRLSNFWKGRQLIFKAELALILAGLLISVYLTAYHYIANVPLACPNKGIINCQGVLSSQFAMIFGLPTAFYGFLFFAMLLYLFAIRNSLKFYLSFIGILFVIYLLHDEYVLGEICEYCTAVHIITVAIFVIELYAFQSAGSKPSLGSS